MDGATEIKRANLLLGPSGIERANGVAVEGWSLTADSTEVRVDSTVYTADQN